MNTIADHGRGQVHIAMLFHQNFFLNFEIQFEYSMVCNVDFGIHLGFDLQNVCIRALYVHSKKYSKLQHQYDDDERE